MRRLCIELIVRFHAFGSVITLFSDAVGGGDSINGTTHGSGETCRMINKIVCAVRCVLETSGI